jgi:hypothetical protein
MTALAITECHFCVLHRDLIDSADKIVGMSDNCERILQSVQGIQVRCKVCTEMLAVAWERTGQ